MLVRAALLLSWLPADVLAFSAQGHRWPNTAEQPVEYMLHPDGTADVAGGSDLEAIRRAFDTWQAVSCAYLSFVEVPWLDPKVIGNDMNSRIFWVENQGEWPGNQNTLALTYAFYTLDTQQITDADIIVNGVDWVWTTVDAEIGTGTPAKVDVETVLFHEIGHFFGLDHSTDMNAAMFPSNNKLKQRAPASDDIAGICALYSNGQPVPGDPNMTMGGPVGAPCQAPGDCASTLCVSDELINQQYCTSMCAPERADCPAGFVCESTQMGGLCLAPAPVEELCDQCNDGSHCASGLCIQVPNVNDSRPFCSRACDPTPGQPQQCPEGYSCFATQQATSQIGACIPNTGICQPLGKGGQNEPCFGNGSCKPGHGCFPFWPGFEFCYGLCPPQADGLSCGPARTRCTALPDVMNTAVCLTIAQAGQPCMPEQCDMFSFCAYDEAVGVDSALCYLTCPGGQNQCPPNFSCTGFQGIPPLCVPNAGFKYDGEVCAGSGECESGLCQNLGQVKLCTRTCAAADPNGCSPGLRCIPEPGSSQGLCWPDSFSDPNARDPSRRVSEVTGGPGYCGCDFTVECDRGCGCDPECGGGCGCTAAGEDRPSAGFVLLLLFGALFLRARRR